MFQTYSYEIPLTKEIWLRLFNVESAKVKQLKAIEKIVKFDEDIRKWPKTIMKYPHKNNTKENLYYYQLASPYCMYIYFEIVFSLPSTPFYAIGPIEKKNALLEFESQVETRINTTFNTVPEETGPSVNEKGSSKKENEENVDKPMPTKRRKEKTKEIDPGFVTFIFAFITKRLGLRHITPN